ncbi:hypothetical protein [Salinicoccus sp. Marseille-QA3877]
MQIKQGDTFHVQTGGTIRIEHIDVNTVKFRYIQGMSKSGEIHRETFSQFVENKYFEKVEG